MADPDDDPLEEIFARTRDRGERFKLWLEHLRSGVERRSNDSGLRAA